MLNNDIMRMLRNMMGATNSQVVDICKLAGAQVKNSDINNFMRGEEDPEYIECPDEIMAQFLNGLIYYNRGKDESRPAMPLELPMTNNQVMKKIKVAFQLREEDLFELISAAGLNFTTTELSAFLRRSDHRNYRPAGDQVLRNLLKGLALRLKKHDPFES